MKETNILVGAISIALSITIVPVCFAQTSNWILANGSGNWFDASHWDNTIPNAPGAVAQFPGGTLSIQLNQQATVGQLVMLAPRSTTLSGTGTLLFNLPGTDPAAISLLQSISGAGATGTIGNPIAIAANESLAISVDQPSFLTLTGPITAGSGDISKTGLGLLTVGGASTTWDGQLSISGGRVSVTNAASLGSTVGHTMVGTGGIVSFQVVTAEPVDLNGGTLEVNSSSALTLSNPIHLIGNGFISDGSRTAGETFNNVIDGTGDVTFQNSVTAAVVIGGASTYSGHSYLSGTSFRATNASSFGDTSQGTTVQLGSLSVEAATDETFTVQNGTLTFTSALGAYNHTVTLDGGKLVLPSVATDAEPVSVQAGGGTVQFQGTSPSFTGGSSGPGNLKLTGTVTINAPLAHTGTLTVGATTFNVADSYKGETFITGNSTVSNAGAFGTSPTVHVQQNSTLTLNAVPSNVPDFVIEAGTIQINDLSRPINGQITFTGGSLPMLIGSTTYNGNIHVDVTSGSAYLVGGTYNGVISGSGNVDMAQNSNTDTITGENTYTGTTRINGTVNANSPHALGSWDRGTVVGGTLNLNAPTDERILVTTGTVNVNAAVGRLPQLAQGDSSSIFRGTQTVALNVPGTYNQFYDVNEGVLRINADTSVDALTIRHGGSVTADSATLSTSTEINLQQGNLEGHLAGTPTIRKTTNEYAHLGSLPDFKGNVIVEKGVLQIDAGSLGTAATVTRVQGTRDAVVVARGDSTIAGDVFLNNATGIDYQGGLRLDYAFYPQTLHLNMQGRLDLGTVGSIIGGTSSGIIDAFGPVTGGSLTKVGTGSWVTIQGNQNTYSGATNVRQGYFAVGENGYVSSTSAIVLYDDVGSDKGTLYLDNGTAGHTDRIADTVPIEFRGGRLYVQDLASEKFGAFKFLEGDSEVDTPGSIGVGSISRQPGATGFAWLHHSTPVDVAPQMVNGVIPWMIIRDPFSPGTYDSFGTYVNGQLRALPASAYANDINSAAATNNVHIAGTSAPLATDKSVNALAFEGSGTLDLGGHSLELASGGVIFGYGGTIKNGRITAGASSGNELVFHSAGSVLADITDNASGPVNATFSPESPQYGIYLSGNNSYTGTTFVNTGQLVVLAPSALPDGADLQLTGGNMSFQYSNTGLRHVGDVRIASDGSLTSSTGGTFSFDQVVIEDGSFSPGKLVGTTPIIKRTTGTGEIAATSNGSTYNGDITVEDGSLTVTGLPSAQFHVNGGTLVLPGGGNDITLNGGALDYIYLTSNITVNSASRIIPEPQSTNNTYGLAGSFSGSGSLTFENRPAPPDPASVVATSAAYVTAAIRGHSPSYTGSVTIDSSTVAIAFADSLGTGDITIRPDGTLLLAPQQNNLAGSKLDLPNTVHLDGGDLEGVSSVFQPQRLLGDLYVTGNSYIGTLEVPGKTHLADGSRLTTTSYLNTKLTGDVLIGGTVEFYVGRTTVRSSALQADRGVVQLGARIVSDAPVSVLNIDNAGLDDLVLPTSFVVQNNQTLAINYRGQPIELSVSGGTISGGGTLLNPIRIDSGGHLSPGNSPGTLNFASSLTVGPGAVYDWEINNPMGTAGDPSGWDLLHVVGPLTFTATPAQPFVVRVIGLDSLPLSSFTDPDLAHEHRWVIATAASIAGLDLNSISFQPVASANPLRTLFAQQFRLESQGGNLFLVFQVPEPSGLATIAVLMVLTAAVRSKR